MSVGQIIGAAIAITLVGFLLVVRRAVRRGIPAERRATWKEELFELLRWS